MTKRKPNPNRPNRGAKGKHNPLPLTEIEQFLNPGGIVLPEVAA